MGVDINLLILFIVNKNKDKEKENGAQIPLITMPISRVAVTGSIHIGFCIILRIAV